MYCTKCGKTILDEQGKYCAYCGNTIVSVTSQTDEQSSGLRIDTQSKPASIIWATTLFYIDAAIWTIICITQWLNFLNNPLLVIWNTAVTVLYYFIASAIFKQKVWGYRWGVGTSLLMAVLSLIYAIIYGGGDNAFFPVIFVILFVIDLAVFIILKTNAQCFGIKKKKRKWSIRFDQNDIDAEENDEHSVGEE